MAEKLQLNYAGVDVVQLLTQCAIKSSPRKSPALAEAALDAADALRGPAWCWSKMENDR
jgi:hypothetical protein